MHPAEMTFQFLYDFMLLKMKITIQKSQILLMIIFKIYEKKKYFEFKKLTSLHKNMPIQKEGEEGVELMISYRKLNFFNSTKNTKFSFNCNRPSRDRHCMKNLCKAAQSIASHKR